MRLKLTSSAGMIAGYNAAATSDTNVLFYIHPTEHWALSCADVEMAYMKRQLTVSLQPNEKGEGVFSLGTAISCRYSLQLHPNPCLFYIQLLEAMLFSLKGTKVIQE
ncbi:hypothetical protein [Shewanella surugensis]|uniref:Uncharacterized protein n=1 Tax=Shewanella surugensis TaxID=212020 RepID=A0ABT0LCD5_9GAMM|nr:hypothetical protein [Shewanella surugensis]MCL1125315.1 hypothetical protein [Shewanella surugensis]